MLLEYNNSGLEHDLHWHMKQLDWKWLRELGQRRKQICGLSLKSRALVICAFRLRIGAYLENWLRMLMVASSRAYVVVYPNFATLRLT